MHSSHSTLDRTGSDAAASLRCRKSTSDLTAKGSEDSSVGSNQYKQALKNKSSTAIGNGGVKSRRGSVKGGLAYLASRRNSRDSIKSACSNTSIFSNDDIGPLVFQASQRGRQRRTSNFLELPGKYDLYMRW